MCSHYLDCAAVACALLMLAACEREKRDFNPPPAGESVGASADVAKMLDHYERNASALAAGKSLWTWYNCNGCHANGGGGSGPPLMDDVWIYGGDAMTIYRTISEGRPNGMPAFRGRVPEDQLWQLTAYVRSLSGLAPMDAVTNRDDAFLTRPPEAMLDQPDPERARPSAGSGQR